MMKSENGVTLTTLVATVIIMLLLTTATVNLTYTGINDYKDTKLSIELGIVREAITEKYRKALDTNRLDDEQFWVGEKIYDLNNIELPSDVSTDIFYKQTFSSPAEYYYRLTPETVEEIGVTDAKHTYIVNYSTGEVYNEKKKKNSASELLYLEPSINISNTSESSDTESFNDWE